MSLSDYSENLILNWLVNPGTSPTRPTTIYAALHTSNPGETGVGELTTGVDSSYIRKAVTFANASGGSAMSSNIAAWSVSPTSAGYTVTHVSLFTTVTGGNCLFIGALIVPKILLANGIMTFNTGDIVVSLD